MFKNSSLFEKFLSSLFIGFVLTGISYEVGLNFGWITSFSPLEAFSVFTSYSCTFLCVVQSRSNYPIGAISVAALCVLFWQQSLFSSMALQIYLFPALLYGWFRWRSDDDTRPVTHVELSWLPVYAFLTVAVYLACYWVSDALGASMAVVDSAVLVLSILAQFLMDNKKIENWYIWIIVDIISVVEYWQSGLKILAIQMGLFGLNAVWGWYEWRKSQNAVRFESTQGC